MSAHKAKIVVENGFDNPATITLWHSYGDVEEKKTWTDVPYGQVGEGALTVNYATGFGSSFDHWHVSVVVDDGPHQGTWRNAGWKECYLTEDDAEAVLQFSVSAASGFKLNMISSGCQSDLMKE